MALIIVGMADLKVARAPDVLTTLGLGSCVGIALYDKAQAIGGLVHIMLPSSKMYPGQNLAKFADTGIDTLVKQLIAMGVKRAHMTAKIAGGAHMFGSTGTNDILKVGARNAEAVVDILTKMRIPIAASDTGGQYGRTIELRSDTGQLTIKTVGFGVKTI